MPSFRGRLWFCSNMYPCKIQYKGYVFDSAECAYQGAKVPDLERYRFLGISGFDAKRLSHSYKEPVWWGEKKLEIMEDILRVKFQSKDLQKLLLNTGDEELVEKNEWSDRFWGTCNGVGENHLGRLLMKIRQELRENIPVIEE